MQIRLFARPFDGCVIRLSGQHHFDNFGKFLVNLDEQFIAAHVRHQPIGDNQEDLRPFFMEFLNDFPRFFAAFGKFVGILIPKMFFDLGFEAL